VIDEAVGQYEKKSKSTGWHGHRKEIERDVMLQILDQSWRDTLGLDTCATVSIAQIATGPLTAWRKRVLDVRSPPRQRGADFVRYITDVEAPPLRPSRKCPRPTKDARAPSANANVVGRRTELPTHGAGQEGTANRATDRSKRAVLVCSGRKYKQSMADPKAENALRRPSEPWRTSKRGGARRRILEDRRQARAPRNTGESCRSEPLG